MSAVMRVPWTNRLTKMIREPGGMRVEDALEGAKANLETIREGCLEAVDARLTELDRLHREAGAAPTAELKDAIYAQASDVHSVAGVFGLQELGEAAFSLCDLVDRLRALDRWDPKAIEVHLNALRLFREPQPQAAAAVLEGLRRVSGRLPKAAEA